MLLCVAAQSNGQSELLQWVVPTLGQPTTYKEQLHVEPDGTFFLTGAYFSGNPERCYIGDTSLVTSGNWNVFTAKYHNDGQLDWAACSATAGIGSGPMGAGLTATGTGDVVVCGHSYYSTAFGPYAYTAPSNKAYGFVVRYDSTGNPLWATFPRGNGSVWIYDVDRGPNGDFYVLGTCDTSIVFGQQEFHFEDEYYYHEFLARINADGDVVWLIGGNSDGNPSMHVAANGDVILAGSFNWLVRWGGLSAECNGSFVDDYIVRIDPNGEMLWLSTFGGISSDYDLHIAFDDFDNTYFLVDLSTSLQFNGGSLPDSPGGDASIVKINGFGELDTIVHLGIPTAGYYPEHMIWDPSGTLSVCGEPDANDDDWYCVQLNSFTMEEVGTRYFPSHPVPMWADADEQGNLYTFGWAYGPFQICDTSFINPNQVNGSGFLDKFAWYDPATVGLEQTVNEVPMPYPNPTSGRISIPDAGFDHVRILTLRGTDAMPAWAVSGGIELDLGALAQGSYIALLSGPRGEIRYRLVKLDP